MTAQSTEDVSIWITTGTPTTDTVTSATKAAPSVVSLTAAAEATLRATSPTFTRQSQTTLTVSGVPVIRQEPPSLL